MKIKMLLLPFTLLLTGADGVTVRALPSLSFAIDPIGPFEANCDDFTLTGKVGSTKRYTGIKERLSVGKPGKEYTHFSTTAAHSAAAGKSYSFSFVLPLKTMLNATGIEAKIEVLNSSGTALLTTTFSLYPIKRGIISTSTYYNKYYTVDNVVVDVDDYEDCHTERYYFKYKYNYFDEVVYHRLTLTRFCVSYECFLDFPGCTAKLHFVDYNRVFPYLDSHTSTPTFDIPLTTYVRSGVVYFDFPNMYVNPDTLDMSLIARPGFELTKQFFLPINKMDLLLDQVFNLQVSEFGYGKTSFSWDIKYLTNYYLIGDCNDSEYCVIGEVI